MIETTARAGGWFIPAFLCALFISFTAPLVGVAIKSGESVASKRPKDPSCPDCKPANRPFLHQGASVPAGALAVAE